MASEVLPADIVLGTTRDEQPGRISDLADRLRGLGQDQQRMLDVIDGLRSATLEEVKLPQLVVVGDQSAGKSSVLDAISGIPIPKDPDGCTRFATEYRLRRGSDFVITVGIIPSKTRTVADRDRLCKISYRATDAGRLSEFIKECEYAIFEGDRVGHSRFASRDIMMVEIAGPTMPLLTLVDLPGFIHAPNNKQTAEDIAAINEIAFEYMSRPRTIILAVVAGSSDYATQVVLKKALDCDKRGVRTLGIVTKPDLSSSIGLEAKFLRLVKNEDIKLDLGWHVLRNRAPQEMDLQADARNQKETGFFTQGKWGTLPSGTYGIKDLIAKLSDLLYDHITEYFPQLLQEIKGELQRSEEELSAMGRRIDTEQEMMVEVVELFSRSKDLIKSGIYGLYSDQQGFFNIWDSEESEKASPRNLRARIWRENTDFEENIRIRGSSVRLVGKGAPSVEDALRHAESERTENLEDYERTVQRYLDRYMGRHLPGDHDPLLVYQLFADYSNKWDDFARSHTDRMQTIANDFLQQVVNSVWPQRMRTQLWSTLLNQKLDLRQARAKEELKRLLVDRQRCSPIYGPEYPRRLKELQENHESGELSPARSLLQKMLVYYELTSKTFISNVITQVVERHLIDELDAVFDMTELHKMGRETVANIAAEDPVSRTKRDHLEQKVAGLKKAHNDCQAIAMANVQKTGREHESPSEQKHLPDATHTPRSVEEERVVAPHRRRSSIKPSKPESAGGSHKGDLRRDLQQARQDPNINRKSGWERSNGVTINKALLNGNSSTKGESRELDSDQQIKKALEIFSDDEDDLAY